MTSGRCHGRTIISSAQSQRRTLCVLIVEDEPLVAMELAAIVEDAGHTVLGPVSTCPQALALIADAGPDMALLDGNLNGERIDAVADVLSARATPFAFISGGSGDDMPLAHKERPLVGKPFHSSEIEQLLQDLAIERKA
jgi:CheY-like chemotaxis protein